MKLTTYLLLLVAGFDLFLATSAGFSGISLDLLEKLKTTDDVPAVPIDVEVDNDDYFDKESANELPETPPEIKDVLPQSRAAGMFHF